ncbi:hypothetical protein SCHPADRAFT_529812 [Schizopora paradoxa]|uniref:Secreted protein n=1 Tax=Schizopora paradoxa TaxID=27342 RepID=A0A0H2RF28_9AGAM|nr:hypothetical protein SCHPADRAFT_529812 [Schizopora paradoxa]
MHNACCIDWLATYLELLSASVGSVEATGEGGSKSYKRRPGEHLSSSPVLFLSSTPPSSRMPSSYSRTAQRRACRRAR